MNNTGYKHDLPRGQQRLTNRNAYCSDEEEKEESDTRTYVRLFRNRRPTDNKRNAALFPIADDALIVSLLRKVNNDDRPSASPQCLIISPLFVPCRLPYFTSCIYNT